MEVSPRTHQILAAIGGELTGTDQAVPLSTLLTRLRQKLPLVPAEAFSAEIATAAGAGLLHIVDAAVALPPDSAESHAAVGQDREGLAVDVDRPLRAVVVDVESVVRLDPDAPGYRDARIWQIGAVKLSADSTWVSSGERFSSYVSLPDDDWLAQLHSEQIRARVRAGALSPVEALEQFRDFCADADVLVAYNGTSADFPLLEAASDRALLPHPTGIRVDAFYLALACWPYPVRSHRLAELAADVGVDTRGLTWHDAADDAALQ